MENTGYVKLEQTFVSEHFKPDDFGSRLVACRRSWHCFAAAAAASTLPAINHERNLSTREAHNLLYTLGELYTDSRRLFAAHLDFLDCSESGSEGRSATSVNEIEALRHSSKRTVAACPLRIDTHLSRHLKISK